EADLIQLAGPAFIPLALALLRRKPTVVAHHGYQSICPNGLLQYEPTRSVCPGHFMARRYFRCLRCNAVTTGLATSLVKLLLMFPRRWMVKRVAVNTHNSYHLLRRLQLPASRVIYRGVADPLS